MTVRVVSSEAGVTVVRARRGGMVRAFLPRRHLNPDTAGWRAEGACRGLDPEVMFPHRGDTAGVVVARALCAMCPVTEECLAFALQEPAPTEGIWGGTSERQRRVLRRTMNLARPRPPLMPEHGTPARYRSKRFMCRCVECCSAMTKYLAEHRYAQVVV